MVRFASAKLVRGCPNRETLIDFDLGKLSAHELDAIAQHLSFCEPCEKTLRGLQSQNDEDRLIGLLKKSLKRPPLPVDPAGTTMEVTSGSLTVSLASSGEEPQSPDPGPAAEAVIAQSFGQYVLYDKLGQGGMGVVYRARQLPLKRMVALKMILAGHHAGARAVARFLREGEAIARLRHANVVQVYELGESEGHPYFSMELVEGGCLQAKLKDGGPLEPRKAAELVRTLAAAVEYAHQRGVIHRDLKPANILLARDGTPKITDFGLAKLLDADSDGTAAVSLTETDTILGTASYMAPEQAEGRSADIGRTTDVYALGGILFAMLTGRSPFVGETKLKTLDLVRNAPPTPPSRLRPGIPSWLEAICLKCLEKSPTRRYPSAQALADDLGYWLRDERPPGIPGWLTRVRGGVRRNRVAVLTGTALLTVGLALFALRAAVYLKSPEHAVQRIMSELAQGRAVTLIGSTGEPKWMRWEAGKSNSQWNLDEDNTFRVYSGKLSLVELLPDPRTERYRFTAEVRHERSDLLTGEVGLFFALTSYPGGMQPQPTHFFTQMTFNDIIDKNVLRKLGGAKPPVENIVQLAHRFYSDDRAKFNVDRLITFLSGPHFKPFGDINPRWHHLEVIVTPERVTARWNEQPPFSTSVPEIEERTLDDLKRFPPHVNEPLPREMRPVFNTRGGLGLYINRGSASFRAVKVTPF